MAAPYYGTVRRISPLWDNTHSLNLENCLLYLSSTISQLFDFVRCVGFDFIFYCVIACVAGGISRASAFVLVAKT